VTGWTQSADFTAGCTAPCTVLDGTYGGGYADAFVTKINAAGTALVYSTYLGGSKDDRGTGIAVDAAGAAYVTGWTDSADFTAGCTAPCTVLNGTLGGVLDAFVSKLDPTGSAIVYSTYLYLGSPVDYGHGIAVDAAGAAYVTGYTRSVASPWVSGRLDAFVTKINAAGTALVYSTYLGGSGGGQIGSAIAVDAVGAAYVTGATGAADFTAGCTAPCTVLDGTLGSGGDAFVAKIADIMSPPAPTPGRVSLRGFIDSAGKGKAAFGGTVQFQSGDPSPTGNLRYIDHVTGDRIAATSFTTLVIGTGPWCGPGTHALIMGKATVNGVPDQDFQVNVDDCSEPGSQPPSTPDMLKILTRPNQVYVNGGPLVAGNIEIDLHRGLDRAEGIDAAADLSRHILRRADECAAVGDDLVRRGGWRPRLSAPRLHRVGEGLRIALADQMGSRIQHAGGVHIRHWKVADDWSGVVLHGAFPIARCA